MSGRDDLEQRRAEERRLLKALDGLPESQLENRPVLEEQLAKARQAIAELERASEARTVALSEGELQRAMGYVREVQDRYQKVFNFYIDLSLNAPKQKSSARLSRAAADILDLHSEVSRFSGYSSDWSPDSTFKVETFQELFSEVVRDHPRVALLGEPGSGKSTTLARLAYEYAQRFLQDQTQPLPIVVELWNVKDASGFHKSIAAELDYALADRGDRRCDLVYLIDGLNETSYNVVVAVERWLRTDPSLATVVACRRADYVDRTLPLRRVTILPFDLRQIRTFIRRAFVDAEDREALFWGLAGDDVSQLWEWFQRNYASANSFESFWHGDIGGYRIHEVEKASIRSMQSDLRSNNRLPAMLEVVRSPYLLTLSLKEYLLKGAVPTTRAGLISAFVTTMLEQARRTGLGLFDGETAESELCDVDVAFEVLSFLAFEITRAGFSTGFSTAWTEERSGSSPHPTDMKAALRRALRGGILQRLSGTHGSSMRFSHQLIQEYCAAVRLLAEVKEDLAADALWPHDAWWEASPWDEVAKFTAELSGDSSDFVNWLAPINPTLAYRCATLSSVTCSSGAIHDLRHPAPGRRVCPIARADGGRELALAGDGRVGTGLDRQGLPEVDWVRIPPGQYIVGGDDSLRMLGLHSGSSTAVLEHEYFVGRYPTTFAQFAPFVSDGYLSDEHWTAEGLEWRADRVAPLGWDLREAEALNSPVVNVTWYEAMAFANWLNKHRGNAFWEISLPTQHEWEIAARYPDGRRYPWGGDYTPGHANIDETAEDAPVGPYFLRSATAVGLYEAGKSHLGLYDMCGNVWEWTRSAWSPGYALHKELPSEGDGVANRGVRGGSWYNSLKFSPAATHDCFDPDLCVFDVGFRLVKRRVGTEFHGATALDDDGPIVAQAFRVFLFGQAGSGKTETMKGISHIPPVSVSKRVIGGSGSVAVEYGRTYFDPHMVFFYSPEASDGSSDAWIRISNGASAQLLVVDGTCQVAEDILPFATQLSSRGPVVVAINGVRRAGYLESTYYELSDAVSGIRICQYDAIDRKSCRTVVELLMEAISQS